MKSYDYKKGERVYYKGSFINTRVVEPFGHDSIEIVFTETSEHLTVPVSDIEKTLLGRLHFRIDKAAVRLVKKHGTEKAYLIVSRLLSYLLAALIVSIIINFLI